MNYVTGNCVVIFDYVVGVFLYKFGETLLSVTSVTPCGNVQKYIIVCCNLSIFHVDKKRIMM